MFQNQTGPRFPAIEKAISDYFEGYLKAEPETLLRAFHGTARLFTTENGSLDTTEMSAWLANLAERRKKGDIRQADARILGIDVSGDAAIAKVRLTFAKFEFTDYLSFLHVGGNWMIVNKIYSTHLTQ